MTREEKLDQLFIEACDNVGEDGAGFINCIRNNGDVVRDIENGCHVYDLWSVWEEGRKPLEKELRELYMWHWEVSDNEWVESYRIKQRLFELGCEDLRVLTQLQQELRRDMTESLSSNEQTEYLKDLHKEIAKQPCYELDDRSGSVIYHNRAITTYCTPGWAYLNNGVKWPLNDNIQIEIMREIETIPQKPEALDFYLSYIPEIDLAVYLNIMRQWIEKEKTRVIMPDELTAPYDEDLNRALSSKELWLLGVERGKAMNPPEADPNISLWSVKRTYSYWHDIVANNREEALLLSDSKSVDLNFLTLEELTDDTVYVIQN